MTLIDFYECIYKSGQILPTGPLSHFVMGHMTKGFFLFFVFFYVTEDLHVDTNVSVFLQTGGDASRSVLSPLFRTASALEFPNRAALMRWPAVIGSEIFISIPSTFSRSSEQCEKKAGSVAGVLQRRIQCSARCRGKNTHYRRLELLSFGV